MINGLLTKKRKKMKADENGKDERSDGAVSSEVPRQRGWQGTGSRHSLPPSPLPQPPGKKIHERLRWNIPRKALILPPILPSPSISLSCPCLSSRPSVRSPSTRVIIPSNNTSQEHNHLANPSEQTHKKIHLEKAKKTQNTWQYYYTLIYPEMGKTQKNT